MRLFDILNSISHTKIDLSEKEGFDKAYDPFMVNRYLSMHKDTVILSGIIDKYPNMPKKAQYAFYLEAIEQEKRYFKYSKKTVDKDVQYVMEYFDVSYEEGLDIKKLLSPKEINIIKDLFTGNK